MKNYLKEDGKIGNLAQNRNRIAKHTNKEPWGQRSGST